VLWLSQSRFEPDFKRRSVVGLARGAFRSESCCRGEERYTWSAGSVHDRELVSEREDLQLQRRAGPHQEPKRVEQRDDDGRHDRRLFENARNLNRLEVYDVHGRYTIAARVPDDRQRPTVKELRGVRLQAAAIR
jgi:hypothetical protein